MKHQQETTPRMLLLQLFLYFAATLGGLIALVSLAPGSLRWLPMGGRDAFEAAQLELFSESQRVSSVIEVTSTYALEAVTPAEAGNILLFLVVSLILAMLVMLPITWTYKVTQHNSGYRKTFVRALIVLPVCATTIVLLIQDSLALAFGLAALVAAVRFRVSLKDPIDGIYVFAAICVGLAAGIGFIGVATVMAIVFCFANAVLWQADYGQNPLDEARVAKDQAKISER